MAREVEAEGFAARITDALGLQSSLQTKRSPASTRW